MLFVVFDAAQFSGTEHFLKEVTDLADNVRSCPRAEGVKEIQLPGDPERRARAERGPAGIALDDGTWGQIQQLAGKLGVAVPNC